jgi:type I restriction enzyme S subunit
MTAVPEKVRQAYNQLPSGWRLEKLKFFADVRNSNVDKTIADDEEPVQLCNYTDVYYNDRITRDLEFMRGSATETEIEKFQLKRNQVIITKDSEGWDDIGIPALVTEDMPDVLCGYHLSVFEPGADLDGAFLAWLCRSEPLNDQFKLGANGVTRYGLGQYPMKNAFAALPPLETQRRIAEFLDEKTARIDGLIAKKRALLERLAEKRQALITRAVTKGLDPAAPMKPSGIDWLGDVPAHWEVQRLRFSVEKIEQGWSPQCENRPAQPGEWGVLKVGCVNGEYYDEAENKVLPSELDPVEKYEVIEGDILISRANTKELLGSAALVETTQGKIIFSDKLYRITLSKNFDPKYMIGVLRSPLSRFQYEQDATGTSGSMQNIGQDTIKNLVHPLPPYDEQIHIGERLSAIHADETALRDRISSSLSRMDEYRAALVTAAVTGKIADLQ